MTSAGTFFARRFEQQCREVVERKLEQTSAFKKTLAGIATVSDAQAKGYAPTDAQIRAIAASIRDTADAAYALPYFCELPAALAAEQLVQALAPLVQGMNRQWREARQFSFDDKDLRDIMEEATQMVAQAHGKLAKA